LPDRGGAAGAGALSTGRAGTACGAALGDDAFVTDTGDGAFVADAGAGAFVADAGDGAGGVAAPRSTLAGDGAGRAGAPRFTPALDAHRLAQLCGTPCFVAAAVTPMVRTSASTASRCFDV